MDSNIIGNRRADMKKVPLLIFEYAEGLTFSFKLQLQFKWFRKSPALWQEIFKEL